MTKKEVTYTPEQMLRTTKFLERLRELILSDTGINQQCLVEGIEMLRQSADAVERVAKLEAALKDLRDTAGAAISMDDDLDEASPAIDAGYVQRVATEAITETKP